MTASECRIVLFAHGSGGSRGGRPDLAAYRRLRRERRLEVAPGATHLFEAPGALESVAALARTWFPRHLATEPAETRHAVH